MRGVGAIIIGIILILAGVGVFAYHSYTTVNANKLCDDWDVVSGTFGDYNSGDKITIIDEINDIRFVPDHLTTGETVDWTFITLKSVDLKIDDVAMMMINPSDIWGFIVFKSDLTDDYKEGDRVEIKVEVVNYQIMGQTAEILDWYEGVLDAALKGGEGGEESYSDVEVANPDDISHGNYYTEIVIGVIIVVGVIVLIIGIVKLVRARRERFKRMYPDYPPSGYQQPNQKEPYPSREPAYPPRASPYPKPQTSTRTGYYPKESREEKFSCPKCNNIMYITIPYRPYKCYCDNCGAYGYIK
jgi:hypothetical protein